MKRYFQEAARSIAEGEEHYSCLALATAAGRNKNICNLEAIPSCASYCHLMCPEEPDVELRYHTTDSLQRGIYFETGSPDEARNLRVLLLLFAGEALE